MSLQGLANVYSLGKQRAFTCHERKQGTPAYMAPEVHATREECAYSRLADVYSLEMTMYEIFSGKSIFKRVYTRGELVRRQLQGVIVDNKHKA